jgi:hypothetical protein
VTAFPEQHPYPRTDDATFGVPGRFGATLCPAADTCVKPATDPKFPTRATLREDLLAVIVSSDSWEANIIIGEERP